MGGLPAYCMGSAPAQMCFEDAEVSAGHVTSGGLYAHASTPMRDRLRNALEARWEDVAPAQRSTPIHPLRY